MKTMGTMVVACLFLVCYSVLTIFSVYITISHRIFPYFCHLIKKRLNG